MKNIGFVLGFFCAQLATAADNNSTTKKIQFKDNLQRVVMSPDNRFIAGITVYGDFKVINVDTGEPVFAKELKADNFANYINWSKNSRYVLVNYVPNQNGDWMNDNHRLLTLVDTQSGIEISDVNCGVEKLGARIAQFTDDSKSIVLGCDNHLGSELNPRVRLYNIEGKQIQEEIEIKPNELSEKFNRKVALIDPAFSTVRSCENFAALNRNGQMALLFNNGEVVVATPSSQGILKKHVFQAPVHGVDRYILSDDGTKLIFSTNGSLDFNYLNMKTGELHRIRPSVEDPYFYVLNMDYYQKDKKEYVQVTYESADDDIQNIKIVHAIYEIATISKDETYPYLIRSFSRDLKVTGQLCLVEVSKDHDYLVVANCSGRAESISITDPSKILSIKMYNDPLDGFSGGYQFEGDWPQYLSDLGQIVFSENGILRTYEITTGILRQNNKVQLEGGPENKRLFGLSTDAKYAAIGGKALLYLYRMND